MVDNPFSINLIELDGLMVSLYTYFCEIIFVYASKKGRKYNHLNNLIRRIME